MLEITLKELKIKKLKKMLFQRIAVFIQLFNNLKFTFILPKPKKILLFDEGHSELLKVIIKKDFNILRVRRKKINILIYLKQIIFFDFKFSTYCKNYIKFISPKVVITLNTKREEFYKLKHSFNNIYFISVMSGLCYNDDFKNKKKDTLIPLQCDYFFVVNKYYINKFQKFIKSEFDVLGHHKNNLVGVNKTKFKGEFLFISRLYEDKYTMNFNKILLNFINLYLSRHNKKLHILLKGDATLLKKVGPERLEIVRRMHEEEINFYKKIFKSNCVFYNSSSWKKKYQILDNFDNIISTYSGMGYEAISRKKKIVFFAPKKFSGSNYYFGWPAPLDNQKKYNFFSSKNLTYKEVERVLNNIKNCTQYSWEKKYYPVVKDQSYFNKDNKKLKDIILKLI